MSSRTRSFQLCHFLLGLAGLLMPLPLLAAVPQVLNHQGRVAVAGVNFNGSGQFKFALVSADGFTTYWSNNGTSTAGLQPTAAVSLAVTRGLYTVLLGDTALSNMTVLPTSVFDNADVRLRVWFNDGSHDFQLMTPDQRLAASPYALAADKANSATSFNGSLAGEVTGTQGATVIAAATVTGKALTSFVSGAGPVSATDTILSAINKLDGNNGLKANAANPSFTGTVNGVTASMVGLGNVNNTSDASKPISALQQTALELKAPIASPTFTGTVRGVSSEMVGLGNVTNTSDASKPVSTAQQAALNLKANLESPTFSGTVEGITSAMVGLGDVDNTRDADKPISAAQQTALALKANSLNPTFTGTATGSFSGSLLGNASTATTADTAVNFTGDLLGEVTGTQGATVISESSVTSKRLTGYASSAGTLADTDTILTAINKLNGNDGLKADLASPTFSGIPSAPTPVAQTNTTQIATTEFVQTAIGDLVGSTTGMLDTLNALKSTLGDGSVVVTLTNDLSLKAPIASPTFTGTVGGITASMVGLGNVTNTSDVSKPVSTAQQAALDLKANSLSPSFSGTVSGISAAMVGLGNVTNTSDASKPVSTAQQTALNEKANRDSPTFTGTVSGISAAMVGLANVTNTSDANKPVSTAQQTALNLKANLISPTFSGTVNGITASMVGLGNVSNTSDASKPVSTAQQAALDLKANLASPTFSGTVQLPAGSISAAPLRLATGTNLTTAMLGSVEFDGNNLYLTTNASSPTRKTVTLSDTGSSAQIALTSMVAAPPKPVLAWGKNTNGQTTVPSLANVAAVAAGGAHSLALLDAGTVVAWGFNTSGQTTVPGTLTGVTEIAAGVAHNLVRKSDGTLVAWGDNTYGQKTIPSGITTATKVAAGDKHSLALLANGSVRAWGDNTFGQTNIPSALTGVTVTAIAAGYDHCLALTSSGTVVAWGRSDADQITVPVGLTGVTAIAAGAYHSLALKSDGTVVAWGWNDGGQVSLLPVGLIGVTKIAAGYAFSMALKSDGTVVAWGYNNATQTTIPADANQVTAIAAGGEHALALRADLISAQVARLDQDNVFSGKVGIKRTPAVNALEVEGTASKTTASSWLANSDRRIKTEIETITGALEKLDQVRLVDFRYTDAYRAAHPSIENVRYPNVIAQEFAEVFPDGVKSSGELMPDGSPILQVDTYPLTIYSAAAVQELHRENLALKKQVNDQEQRLRKLEQILKDK
jgi:hypothetical protein